MTTVLLCMLICVLLWAAHCWLGEIGIAAIAAACMMRVAVVGDVPAEIGLFQSNLGAAYYIPVLLALAIERRTRGCPRALLLMSAIFAVQILSITTCAMETFADPQGTSAHAQAFHLLSHTVLRVSAVSMVAFWISAITILYLRKRPFIGLYTAQIVDSLIFFPLAFRNEKLDLLRFLLDGVIVKIILITLTALPILFLCERQRVRMIEKETPSAAS